MRGVSFNRVLTRLSKIISFPVALLLCSIAAYGLLAPTLGFYWDDWPMIWFAHMLGPKGIMEVLSVDRPFLAGVYLITTTLLKSLPLQWQILAILSRWLAGIALWWSLRQLWPGRRPQVDWIVLLFTLYPGFKQQPIAVVYSNGFILYAAYIVSLGLMIAAVRRPAKYWLFTVLALASYAICTFSTEYYIGLDLIRPLFLWLVLSESTPDLRQRALKTLRHWAPYLVMLGIFLIWRVFIFKFPTYQPVLLETASNGIGSKIIVLLDKIIHDSFRAGWQAWVEIFRFPEMADFKVLNTTLFWAVVAVSIPLVWFYLARLNPRETSSAPATTPDDSNRFGQQLTLLGIYTLLVSGWPFWITDLPVGLIFPTDRFTLAFMLGSAFVLVGLLDWLIHTNSQKVVLLSLLAGLAIGAHFQNANTYRREWEMQKDMFWQMVWRAPGLKTNTLLVTNKLPFQYYSDNSLTAPLNWTYAPDFQGENIPYYLAFTEVRLGRSLAALEEGLQIRQAYRTTHFDSTTSDALVFYYAPPGCLRILDPEQEPYLPVLPDELQEALAISHPAQIVLDAASPASPPQEIFGSEPAHTWCYYFEQADLARQRGDWQQVVRIGDQVLDQGYLPAELSELLVFSDAYFRTGQVKRGVELARHVYDNDSHLQEKTCNMLTRLETELGGETAAAIIDLKNGLPCP